MSDDTRTALGIPRIVQTTSLGVVEVHTLSAVQFITLTEQAVGLGKMVQDEARKDGDTFAAVRRVLLSQPVAVIGLLSGSTRRSGEELGALALDEFLEIVECFIDQHEKSLTRFFALRRKWEEIAAKTLTPASRNSSIRSSRPAGPSPTSEPSASNSSSATPDSELSEASRTG